MKKTMERVGKSIRREDGEIMLESLIVFVIVIFMLFFVLAAFMLLLNRWNMQTAANDAAFRFAQTYKLTKSDDRDRERTGFISPSSSAQKSNAIDFKAYRYFGSNKDNLETTVGSRISAYASDSVSSILLLAKKVEGPGVTTKIVKDSLARKHVEVTITGGYRVLFSEVLSYFGMDPTIRYKVTAYAECLDMVDYINTIDYVTQLGSYIGSKASFTDSVIHLINTFLNLIN